MPYPVWDVTSWDVVAVETSGDEEKDWLAQPALGADTDGEWWLFKPRTEHNTEQLSHVEGQDWAEKIATEVAALIGVPTARVEFAQREGERGHICLNLRPQGWQLQPGLVLLKEADPDYRPGWDRVRGRPGHSLVNIKAALEHYDEPLQAEPGMYHSAFDMFCGYLIFDALIANQDRHDQNWAVLIPEEEGKPRVLSESYDHGSSLGCTSTDDRRQHIQSRPDGVERWAREGRARKIEHPPRSKAMTLVDAARHALELTSPAVRDHWMDRVSALDETYVTHCLREVQGLSEVTTTFTSEVIRINRRRLLDEC